MSAPPPGGSPDGCPPGPLSGSYTTPGGTPKNTAQVENPEGPPRRPRNHPGHLKLCGDSTGTSPRFRPASYWFRRTPPSPRTSEGFTPSTCATQAVSEAVLRSSTSANFALLSRAVRRTNHSRGADTVQRIGGTSRHHRSRYTGSSVVGALATNRPLTIGYRGAHNTRANREE